MRRICLIGVGRIGEIHGTNIIANPRLELTAISDFDEPKAKRFSEKWDVKVVGIEEALTSNKWDGVVIAGPTNTHSKYIEASVAAGKAVFCEKPIDLDLKRAQQCDKVVAKYGQPVLLGFNRRFDPSFQRLRNCVTEHEIGKLETLNIVSHDPAPPPASYVQGSGGIFKDMTIHDLDMARFILGSPIAKVFAAGAVNVEPFFKAFNDVDTAKVIMETVDGHLCTISNSRRTSYGYDQRIEAYGSEGAVFAGNQFGDTVTVATKNGMLAACPEEFFLERYARAYQLEVDHFADVLEGTEPVVGLSDGIAALVLAEAAERSLYSGRWELVDLNR